MKFYKRPLVKQDYSYVVKRVEKLKNEGDYLKFDFHKVNILQNKKRVFGIKIFKFPVNFKGHDRGLYETLIDNDSKDMFGPFYRELEIGEFKNNELNGMGGRYYRDENEGITGTIFGQFTNGIYNGIHYNIEYSIEHGRNILFDVIHFVEGKKINVNWNLSKKQMDEIYNNNIFINPWHCEAVFDNPKCQLWWKKYKKIYLN